MVIKDEGNAADLSAILEKLQLLETKFAALELKSLETQPRASQAEGISKDKNINDADGKTPHESDSTGREQPSNIPISRARIVISKIDPKSGERKDFEASETDVDANRDQGADGIAFLLRKIVCTDEDDSGELEIYGEELRLLLKSLLRHYPYHLFLGEKVTLVSPYEPLILNWDLLSREAEKEVSDKKDQIARSDLRLLLGKLQEVPGDKKLDEYFKTQKSLKSSRSITFDTLWTIFAPGILVYSQLFFKRDQILIVKDNRTPWPSRRDRSERGSDWKLNCWIYDWNGQRFKRHGIELRIGFFQGPKPIAALPVYPLEHAEGKEATREILLQRGKLYRKYCIAPKDKRMFKYHGKAIFDSKGFHSHIVDNDGDDDATIRSDHTPPQKARHSMVSGYVMVDFNSYYTYGRAGAQIAGIPIDQDMNECQCRDCITNEALQKQYRTSYDNKTGDETEKWEPEQVMLCPPRVLGYVLRDKQWAQLDVDCIDDISEERDDSAFWKDLKLRGDKSGEATKKLLINLIKNHGTEETERGGGNYQLDDIVPDKGKGLVILLYGAPGTGKSSTALTLATAVRKPLFPIGVPDVGTSARFVESRLQSLFDLATTWKAILLIDEADVFLQSRALGHMGPTTERNALVSVFLRVLEYYHGILILTTNQIAQFDVAVQSRIHIAVRYDSLDDEQTSAIFMNFLKQYEKKNMVDRAEYEKITKWVKRELPKKRFDGRQIRNLISSTMGIARAQDPIRRMKHDDLLDVVDNMENFKSDLNFQMISWTQQQEGPKFA